MVARFILFEELSDKAARVLEDYVNGYIDLYVPPLLFYEVGNVLWKAVMEKIISVDDAIEKLSEVFKLRLRIVDVEEKDQYEALEFSARNNLTHYDSIYVAVSKKVGLTLLTADDTLYEKSCQEVPSMHLRSY